LVDFSKLLEKKTIGKEINPIDIFDRLDKETGKEYLRPPQITILTEWHEKHRDRKDTIVKLHTGQGKTLIGLLMLQSYLNQGIGPALYLCPNNYLVKQTITQAKSFGINAITTTTDGQIPLEFKNSQSILVTNCKKMFNGKSAFGVAATGSEPQELGAIVIDDAHKCVDIIRESFSVSIDKMSGERENNIYKLLLGLFRDSLNNQGAGTLRDIESGHESILAVPYWTWHDKQQEVLKILQENKNDDGLKFVWDLLRDRLKHCYCIFSGKKVQITPRLLPIEMIPSFGTAKRRIFLSATLMEDAFLVRDLGMDPEIVKNPLFVQNMKYSGERMILIPTYVDPTVSREKIIEWLSVIAAKNGQFGVVSLVPSYKTAESWTRLGGTKTTVVDLHEKIKELGGKAKEGRAKKILIMTNEYDGVDLPDQTCRILCLDSLPKYNSLLDTYEKEVRPSSTVTRRKLAQRVEQGFGRAIRGSSDWCIVIIAGDLTDFLSENSKRKHLSNEAQKQIKISEEVASQLKEEGTTLDTMENVVNQCLNRDAGWKEYYRQKMDEITATKPKYDYLDTAVKERTAEINAQQGLENKAVEILENLKSNLEEKENAWYLQLMGTYLYPVNQTEAMDKQLKAFSENSSLFRPDTGVTYSKLAESGSSREQLIIEWINKFESHSAMIVHLNNILQSLYFGASSELFESNLQELGQALGFHSQRPEKESGKGPDNLWRIKNKSYWILSCKNETQLDQTIISKSDAGQISNDIAWFKINYDGEGHPIFVHPGSKLDQIATIDCPVWVIGDDCLKKIKTNILNFFNSFRSIQKDRITSTIVAQNLKTHHLDTDELLRTYASRVKT